MRMDFWKGFFESEGSVRVKKPIVLLLDGKTRKGFTWNPPPKRFGENPPFEMCVLKYLKFKYPYQFYYL